MVAGGLDTLRTAQDEPLVEALGEEPVALFVPQENLKATTGFKQRNPTQLFCRRP